ncbi:hypothetical protein K9L27_04180 [Candidatus Gracilibacteria bacterium]|nr:hypothetical protein [Candidatus Gracilibacteria bacterium]
MFFKSPRPPREADSSFPDGTFLSQEVVKKYNNKGIPEKKVSNAFSCFTVQNGEENINNPRVLVTSIIMEEIGRKIFTLCEKAEKCPLKELGECPVNGLSSEVEFINSLEKLPPQQERVPVILSEVDSEMETR